MLFQLSTFLRLAILFTAVVITIFSVLIFVGGGLSATAAYLAGVPLLLMVVNLASAFSFPFNRLRDSAFFMFFRRYQTAENILRAQIDKLERLAATKQFPFSWYVGDTTLDTMKVRLARSLMLQGKAEAAKRVYDQVDVSGYEEQWIKNRNSLDVCLYPEISKYHALIGKRPLECMKFEHIELISLIPNFFVDLLLCCATAVIFFATTPPYSDRFLETAPPVLQSIIVRYRGDALAEKGDYQGAINMMRSLDLSKQSKWIRYGVEEKIAWSSLALGLPLPDRTPDDTEYGTKHIAYQKKLWGLLHALRDLPSSRNELKKSADELESADFRPFVTASTFKAIVAKLPNIDEESRGELNRIEAKLARAESEHRLLSIGSLLFGLFLMLGSWAWPPFKVEKLLGVSSSRKDNR